MASCFCGTRRDFVRLALGGSVAAGLAARGAWTPAGAQEGTRAGTAKACILLWMQGAQSQIDTWDPKPGTETGGPFQAIPTSTPGVRISEHLPRSAKQMDKVALVRTLHSKDPNHDTAGYLLHTGYRENPDLRHPHVGSVILQELGGAKTDLPGCIVLGGEPPAGAAYLPAEHGPSIIERLENPTADLVTSTEYFAKGTLERRWRLLNRFDEDWRGRHEDERVLARRRIYERAWKLLSSADLKAFETAKEPDAVRKLYGETPLGRALLLARRLVQGGVRFVEVQYGNWDSHADNFNAHRRLMSDVDGPFAALLEDLSRSGLLAETMVVLTGEFGRTPRINAAQGRDHWTRNWCACLAGGGVAGGRVVGRTDERGVEVEDRPVAVADLFATIYRCFGIRSDKTYDGPGERPLPILEGGKPVEELF
jgi:hypothetical protein